MTAPVSSLACISKSLLFPCCRRPRRGSPNWAKWSHGMIWAVETRRAVAQTATMKMGVKHREKARTKTVSHTRTVQTQFYREFFFTLSVSNLLYWHFCPHNRVQTFTATESFFVLFFCIPLKTFTILASCIPVILEASAMLAAQEILQIRRWYTLTVHTHVHASCWTLCPISAYNRHKVLNKVAASEAPSLCSGLPAWLQRVILVTVWLIT